MTLIDLSIHRAETYLREAIDGFIADPPDDDYQRVSRPGAPAPALWGEGAACR